MVAAVVAVAVVALAVVAVVAVGAFCCTRTSFANAAALAAVSPMESWCLGWPWMVATLWMTTVLGLRP
jgi:hypothetical protein